MDRKPRVFVSIPNTGWVRQEIASNIIPTMLQDERYEVFVEPLYSSLDRDKYIFSNRNRIVRRFKQTTDRDFLLMIDADTVPLFNPLELVDFGCDIIAAPECVIKTPEIVWSAWKWKSEEEERLILDPVNIEKQIEAAIQVDVVGTGCIAIKRAVLEKMPRPFSIETNEDGILAVGPDVGFCDRAKDYGFEVWTTTKFICEHYKELPLYFARKWGAIP